MKLLLALVFSVSTASAQVVTTHLILPGYGGVDRQATLGLPVNNLACWRFPARLGITNATKFASALIHGATGSAFVSWALYPDDDTGTDLAILTANATLAGLKTATVPAFSLVQGVVYRLCFCMTNTAITYLGVTESAPAGSQKDDVVNATYTSAALANPLTNGCAVGVAPPTTGALGTHVNLEIPVILLEN